MQCSLGLQIIVPPDHDLFGLNRDAPRLLQTISGDFVIETKIADGEGGRKSGGLLVWKDEGNYIRFETSSSWVGFNFCTSGYFRWQDGGLPPVTKPPVLRLERQGHRFSAHCSLDGENWLTCGWVDLPMDDPIQVGIHALCPQSPATLTRFEYFKVFRP